MYIAHNLMAANTARNLNTHYANLAVSIKRLSSGLRVNAAKDDAAGLSIRELQRAECAALNQGAKNVNDAISMLQVTDGALGIIDEKLIRLRELSEQAASGTYSSTQRLIIDEEFQAMGQEIDRIARSTDFNGIKLIDGEFDDKDYIISLSGEYIVSSFQNNNVVNIKPEVKKKYEWDSKGISDPSLLVGEHNINIRNNNLIELNDDSSLIIYSLLDPIGKDTDFQIANGYNNWWYINGKSVSYQYGYGFDWINSPRFDIVLNGNYIDNKTGDIVVLDRSSWEPISVNWHYTPSDGGLDAMPNGKPIYIYISNFGSVIADMPNYNPYRNNILTMTVDLNADTKPGVNVIKMDWDIYSNIRFINDHNAVPLLNIKLKVIDKTGSDPSSPDYIIPNKLVRIHFCSETNKEEDFYDIYKFDATRKGLGLDDVQIQTQESAQKALIRINDAMVKKDKMRAYFGGMQNRLENTLTNVTIQSENLQAAESRISDADIAQEMTNFVKNQILVQSAISMLTQANSLSQIVM